MQKYAFVDRDGTILWEPKQPSEFDPRDTYSLRSIDDFKFMDGAITGMKKLAANGYKFVLATNQTYLGTPKNPRETFDQVMAKLKSELSQEGLSFDFIMVCPHGPDEGCECRKPKIGGLKPFLEANKGQIDFENSLMFGDRDTDGEFAKNLGVRFVRIKTNEKFDLPDDI